MHLYSKHRFSTGRIPSSRRAASFEGFTLVECMIVVAIIGLLAMVAIPSWSAARERSQKEMCKSNQNLIWDQLNVYCLEHSCSCSVGEFGGIDAVRQALIPASGTAYINSPNAFRCPADGAPDSGEHYSLQGNGNRIIGIVCNIDTAHNED